MTDKYEQPDPKQFTVPREYAPQYFHAPKRDEINVRDLVNMLWKGKFVILAFTFIFAIGSIVWSLSLPNVFTSQARLAPAEDVSGVGGNRMPGQLGGLASFAGIQIAQGEGNKTAMAEEILRSRRFITEFVNRRDILPELMAVDEWNPTTGEIIYDAELYDSEAEEWVKRDAEGNQQPPTPWQFVQEFRNIFYVDREEMSGFTNIGVTHQSPIVAKQWVDWLIEDINNELRRSDVDEAERSMEFLQRELSQTSLSTAQQVFYQLIEKQTQTIMMANVRPEYVFRILDPPVVAEEKSAPARALIVILFTFIGGFLGVICVVFVSILKQDSADE